MIEVLVTLADAVYEAEEFEVRCQGDVYNGELPDFNAAVKAALDLQFLAHPLDPLDSASLEVSVRRVHQDTATRDGKGVSARRGKRSSWGVNKKDEDK